MRKNFLPLAISYSLLPLLAFAAPKADEGTKAAYDVICRFVGEVDPRVELVLDAKGKKIGGGEESGAEWFKTEVKGDKLVVSGNTPIALTRGFYTATKAQKRGMNGWAGNRFADEAWTKEAEVKGSTPFEYRYYFNVVTYGYTMPYWTWKRWSQEIDYMALHGINSPITLVAQEAIMARVFKSLGLTDQEIQSYFVGPAHLPWMRMGNISGLDSPMPLEWHTDQIQLQHKILKKMRALKMKPICPGFAGFVPPALKRIYPDLELVETKWCGGRFHNWMVMPNHPVFEKIGTAFIKEWEKEFGKCDLYLIDSFNEMETPFPPKGTAERYNLMNEYGEKVYRSIAKANPDAIWVMQGWMFGFQRYVWDQDTLAALLKKVPDDKMILLDEAVDYNKHWWRSTFNWDFHKGFYNKRWIYSVIPNMGGKCGLTGVLDFYANGHLEALNSPNRGRLVGHGMAPEGIENNQVIYEIMTDAAWRTEKADIRQLLRDYSTARYGKYDPALDEFWDGMLKSCYGSFADHPQFTWQLAPGRAGKGSINTNPDYYRGIEAFASVAYKFKDSPLFKADLIEYAVAYAAGRVEELIIESERAMREGEDDVSDTCEVWIERLLMAMDRLLESHPHFSMQRWIDFARAHGGKNEKLADYYEKNARRIVTIWGPPVDDYACRVWAGLIRDYYAQRRKIYIANKRGKSNVNRSQWERDWVEKKTGLSEVKPYDNPIVVGMAMVQDSAKIVKSLTEQSASNNAAKVVGSWSPQNVALNTWKDIVIPCSTADIRSGRAIRLRYIRGSEQLEIKRIAIEMDGKFVAKSEKFGISGIRQENNILSYDITDNSIGNNSCNIVLTVRTSNKNDSYGAVEILPKKGAR